MKKQFKKYLAILLACIMVFPELVGSISAAGASLVVTNGNDSGPGSLRDTIANAPEGSIITFAPDVKVVSLQSVITFEQPDLTISGRNESGRVTIQPVSGGFTSFLVSQRGTLVLHYLTFNGAKHSNSRGGHGAAVYAQHAIMLYCNFNNNQMMNGWGGAVFVEGDTIMENCNFSDNFARFANVDMINIEGNGGALVVGGSASLSNCIFRNNDAFSTGGAACFLDNATLTDCDFLNNTAVLAGAITVYGGKLTIKNCELIDNKAIDRMPGMDDEVPSDGGAIYLDSSTSLSSDNCLFLTNKADGLGGSICGIERNSIDLKGTVFVANNAERGGAIYAQTNSTLKLENCGLGNNHALTTVGGGLALNSGSTSRLIDCDFTYNSAIIAGGAMYAGENCTATLEACTFNTNEATDTNSYGGGLYTIAPVTMTDCEFKGNKAGNAGGGMLSSSADNSATAVNLKNCTFTGNTALEGGGLYADRSAALENCVFDQNTATRGGALLTINGFVVTIKDSIPAIKLMMALVGLQRGPA